MRFQSDAVDLDSARLQVLDEILCGGGLIAGILDVIVVVVKFDLELVLLDSIGGGLERHWNVLGPNGVVPNITGVGASWAVGEGFVDNVPAVAAITEVLDQSLDVVLEDGAQGSIGPGSRRVGDP